jgi:hypothetical protein
VFAMGGDALAYGVVANLGRHTENVTGVSFLNTDLGPKRLRRCAKHCANARISLFSKARKMQAQRPKLILRSR